MKKGILSRIFILCNCLIFFGLNAYAQNVWTQIDSLPGLPRFGAAAFSLNSSGTGAPDVGYVTCGGSAVGVHYTDLWQYDPAMGAWSEMASLPDTNRGSMASFVINNQGYIACGATGSGVIGDFFSDLWMYDAVSNTWTQKASMPTPGRWGPSGFSLNGKGYVTCGNEGTVSFPNLVNDVWQYDPVADSWTQMNNFPGSTRLQATTFTIDTTGGNNPNKAYLCGGLTSGGAINDLWEYDPVADSWTSKAAYPGGNIDQAVSFSIANEGYVGLGTSSSVGQNVLYQYTWATNSWLQMVSFPAAGRVEPVAFTVIDSAYCGTGYTTEVTNDFYKYAPLLSYIRDTVTTTICQGQSYDGHIASGTYTDTFTEAGGNDSIRVLYLAVNPLVTDTISAIICSGQSYAGHSATGTYIDTFTAANGCDSIRTLNLSVNQVAATTITTSICPGQSYDGYSVAGTYIDTFTAANGCDSIRTLNLAITGQDSWTKKSNFPGTGSQDCGNFVINNIGYAGGGGTSPDFWAYDPATDSWSQEADFSSPRYEGVGFAVNGKGYIGSGVTGASGTILNDLWQYDPVANTWTQKNNMPGDPRWADVAVVANNRAYCGFGNFAQLSGAILANDFWVYNDVTDTWTALANFPAGGRLGPAIFCLDSNGVGAVNTIYVGTGWDGTNYDNDFWAFNIGNNSWEQKQNFPGAGRTAASAFALQNRGYTGLGGYTSTTVFGDFYEYSPAGDQWTAIANYPLGGLVIANTFVIGNYGYVTCGHNYDGLQTNEVYVWGPQLISDTVNSTICQGQSYNGHITSGTYVDTFTAADGCDSIRTLNLTVNPIVTDTISATICAGQNYDGYSLTGTYADTYTAVNGCDSIRTLNLTMVGEYTWLQKNDFINARTAGISFSIDTDGDGIPDIAFMGMGSIGSPDNNGSDLWRYNPTTDTWSQMADITGGRANCIYFSLDGKGYVGGGNAAAAETPYTDFWQYDPSSNTWTQKNNLPGGNGRWGGFAVGINHHGYFGFGAITEELSSIQNDFWQYDPINDSWTQLTSFPSTNRLNPVGFAIDSGNMGNDLVFVGSGWDGANANSDFWAYNIQSASWEKKQNIPGPIRTGATAFSVSDYGFLGLGVGSSLTKGYLNDFYEYNAFTGNWTTIVSLPGPRDNAMSFVVGGNPYVLCGNDSISDKNDIHELIVQSISDTINSTICHGQHYEQYTTTGIYVDTLTASSGCDSIRILNLTVNPVVTSTITQSLCSGQGYYGHNATGTYIDTFTAANSCDSIRTLKLTILPVSRDTISEHLCPGYSYEGHNTTGVYADTLSGSGGCDSIIVLNLFVTSPITDTIDQTICQGQRYEQYDITGIYVDTLTAFTGCDSIRTLFLTVLAPSRDTATALICSGQSYGGHTSSGIYVDTFTASDGCDSIRTLFLTISSPIRDTMTQYICAGGSYDGYTIPGTYADTFIAVGGCDSIRTLYLFVSSPILDTITTTICAGSIYYTYNGTGTYSDTFTAIGGCDSIRTLYLTVLPYPTNIEKYQICQGDIVHGYGVTGVYFDTVHTPGACDSIITFEISVNPIPETPVITEEGDTLISSPSYRYQWFYEGSLLPGDTGMSLIVTSSGGYVVEAIDTQGCTKQSALYVTTGISDVATISGLSIYPNPANDNVQISFNDPLPLGGYNLQVYDMTGRVIYTQKLNTGNTTVNVYMWSGGLYLFRIDDEQGKEVTVKLVKE